jgi:tripartite-type tricarboxylate transporter receptor subunit TctC
MYKKPLYDSVNDFAPVALVADSARVLITRKDFPPNTLAEFIAYAKANQEKMLSENHATLILKMFF